MQFTHTNIVPSLQNHMSDDAFDAMLSDMGTRLATSQADAAREHIADVLCVGLGIRMVVSDEEFLAD